MLASTEVRWFLEGASLDGRIPAGLQEWLVWLEGDLRGADGQDSQDRREDLYLALRGNEDLGIKLRGGSLLEIKLRVGVDGVRRWGDAASGLVERWLKWSISLAGVQDPAGGPGQVAPVARSGRWIPVRKHRRLAKFAVAAGGSVERVALADWPAEGCQVELTRLECAGSGWWTVGFEAFGSQGGMPASLDLVARRALSLPGAPSLPPEQSCGYPAWLARLLRTAPEQAPSA